METSASYFQRCPAKRGFGQERKHLLKELYMAENMLTHATILTMSNSPSEKHVSWRAELEADRGRIVKRLQEITGPFKQPKNKL